MTPDRPGDPTTVRNLGSPWHAAGTASADIDDSSVSWPFHPWEDLSAESVILQHKNLLVSGADRAALATAFIATLQGGYLMSAMARHIAPLEVAVEMALHQVARSLADEHDPGDEREYQNEPGPK